MPFNQKFVMGKATIAFLNRLVGGGEMEDGPNNRWCVLMFWGGCQAPVKASTSSILGELGETYRPIDWMIDRPLSWQC